MFTNNINELRSKFFVNTSYFQWELKANYCAFCFVNKVKMNEYPVSSGNSYDQFTNAYNLVRSTKKPYEKLVYSILTNIFIKSDFLYLNFLNFKEEQNIIKLKSEDFILNFKSELSLIEQFVKKYNYESDIGFHIFPENLNYCYFYGEDFYSANHNLMNPWQDFHVFIIEKTEINNFIHLLNGKFNYKKMSNDLNLDFIFGSDFYLLIPV
jgi:hypothetical protein